jgi:hypothetical protein
MNKLIVILHLFLSLSIFGQAPSLINYQGIARDANGGPITNPLKIRFEIYSTLSGGTPVFSEIQTVTSNSLGIFSTQIGKTTGTISVNWAAGNDWYLDVALDPSNVGTSFTSIGRQQLVSVPYALYAKQAGNSLPPGNRNGQTLRWDTTLTTPSWVIDNNLTNDGSHIGVGLYPAGLQSRLHVTTNSIADTSVIFAYHPNIASKGAAVRGLAVGNVPAPVTSQDPFAGAVFGGNHSAFNSGTGFAIGSYGFGSSNGIGIGLTGVGLATAPTSTAVGLYVTAIGNPTANKMAAIFDKGPVFFNDSIYIAGTNSVNANPGDVLTLSPYGRAKWLPAGGPWQRTQLGTIFTTHLAFPNDDVSIGLPSTIGANEKLHLHNQTGDAYMQLSTAGSSNAVGFVFGTSSAYSKAYLRFDNLSNTLIYNLINRPVVMIDGGLRSTLIGKIPFGASSQSALNAYDSIGLINPKPIFKVINSHTLNTAPTALYIGHNNTFGTNIVYRKEAAGSSLSFEDNSLGTKYHTFQDAGRYYPGSDGGAGKAYIQGGQTITDNLVINSSTTGDIVMSGFTKLGGISSGFPAVQVIEVSSTMPSGANSNIQLNLGGFGITSSQIEGVQILCTTATRIVPPSYTYQTGFEYHYEIGLSSPTIFIWTTGGNSSQIFNQPVKVLVTIKK